MLFQVQERLQEGRALPIDVAERALQWQPKLFDHAQVLEQGRREIYRYQYQPAPSGDGDQ